MLPAPTADCPVASLSIEDTSRLLIDNLDSAAEAGPHIRWDDKVWTIRGVRITPEQVLDTFAVWGAASASRHPSLAHAIDAQDWQRVIILLHLYPDTAVSILDFLVALHR